MEEISLLVAFSAGLLSFLSPCVLPLVPVYLASLYGPEIFEPAASKRRFTIFLHSLSFVTGFSLVFVMLGAGAGLVGFAIPQSVLTRLVAGGLLTALGLFMLASWRIPRLNFQKMLTHPQITTGYLRSLLIGGVFALAWTPCVGPILGGILTFALTSETAGHGAYLLGSYSLGLGLPFLVTGAIFDSVTPLLRRLYRYSNLFSIISAALLIAMGILILTNKLFWLQAQLTG